MRIKRSCERLHVRLRRTFVVSLFAIYGWAFLPSTLLAAPRLVVVLFPQNNDGSPGNFLVDQTIRTTFAAESSERFEIYNEYLDLAKPHSLEDDRFQRDFLRTKYAHRKVDLVIAGLSSGLDFALANRDLFPGVPIVYCAVDQSEIKKRDLPPDVVGHPAEFDVPGTLELGLKLLPRTQHVALVAGCSEMDTAWAKSIRKLIEAHPNHVNLIDLTGLNLEELLQRSSHLPDNTIVYYAHIFQDGNGHTHVPSHILETLSQRVNAPIFSHVDTYIGRGVVGGHVFKFQSQGRNAAHVALRILAGESPQHLRIDAAPSNAYEFDGRQLERWKIDEWLLPESSVIRFREEPFLTRYRSGIALLAGFCLAQMGWIVGLLLEKHRRRRSDQRLQNALVELQVNQRQLRQLSGNLIDAQESERRRIARELHDDFNQMLALLSVQLDLLRQKLPSSPPEVVSLTMEITDRVRSLSTAIHELSHELHPLKLEQLGLVTAIRGLCKEVSLAYGLVLDFSAEDIPRSISPDISLCLYRIVQEALRNVVKHSQAREASVALARTTTEIVLRVIDHGIGLMPGTHENSIGLGLISIRERLYLVGGTMTIETTSPQGTTLIIRVPLPERVAEPDFDTSTPPLL